MVSALKMSTTSSDHTLLLKTDEDGDEQQQTSQRRATFTSAIFNVSTTIVGAGIMGLPATMRIIGLVPGFFLVIFVALLSNKSMDFLLKHTKAARAVTYGAVMGDAFGQAGCMAAQICIIINSFGTLVVYLIIMADVLSGSTMASVHHTGVLEEWAGGHTWWNRRSVVIISTTIFVLAPLVCFRHIDSLRVSSALSVALAVLFVVATAVVAIWKIADGDIDWPRLFPDFSNDSITAFTVFSVVPVVVTAFLCQHCAHPILNELERTSNPHAVVECALILCTGIYLATSLFAYLLFGDNTMTDVLSNFDVDLGIPYSSVISDMVRVGYAVHLMLVFPLLHFSLRLNLDGLIFSQAVALGNNTQRFALLTISTMMLCLLAACLVPNIWDVFQITGSTSAIVLCYILPASLVLRDAHGISSTRGRWIAWFMIIVATASGVIALTGFFLDLFGVA